ncbi:hypothetical protein Afil01_50430 [Actinorhabdospora filicis]|uniref:DUF2079 domain-containing protein n=1 Tax=Actinorhabdospora filicis TaxID=1785913 RepID=A0A9W6SQ77_9ACTN|nr:DUF2079 domain-containing protein [Actinorhabdospora filicis]GLZ80236.1 hypothetical protein Afil01_50430 [Actinorhabdospora filicis]
MPTPLRRLLVRLPVPLTLFALYTAVSVNRHRSMLTSGFDLGIFTQAVRGYAELRAPVAELKSPGFALLGDHFHPVLALLAPLYRLWPSPVTLLVAQAALLALSAVPVTTLATERLGRLAGTSLGLAYGLSWGIQGAVGFDFHEIAFAVPLLAMSLTRLARGHHLATALWALPLLLVKEDQAATVAAIGVLLLLRGSRRLGAALTAVAALAGFLLITVVIPAMNPLGTYEYLHSARGHGENPFARLLLPLDKAWLPLALLAPTLLLAARSSIALIAVPTLLLRMWSANESYWGTGFHYSAVLMPVVFTAMLDARVRHRLIAHAALAVALAWTATGLPLREAVTPDAWRVPSPVTTTETVLALIPEGTAVAADNRFAAALTARHTVYLFPTHPSQGIRPEWVAVSDPPGRSPLPAAENLAAREALPGRGYLLVAGAPGIRLYRLPPPG